MKSALDLFLEWPRIPIPTVVDALRSVHERASDAAQTPPVAEHGVDPQRAALPDLSPLLGALAMLHNAAHGATPEPATYDQMRRHFFEFQSQLRRQKLAIERLIGHTFDPADPARAVPPVFQQALHLQCPRGGRSSARFRCVNRTGRATQVTVTAAPLLGDVSGHLEQAALTVSPETYALAPGRQRTMLVTVDLSKCAATDRQAGAALDVSMDGELALKVWVAVDLHD